jgi:hypothetical protein
MRLVGPNDDSAAEEVLVAAAAPVVVGTMGSVVAALTVKQNGAQRSRQDLATTPTEIAATLKLAIQREQDLAVSVGSFRLGK